MPRTLRMLLMAAALALTAAACGDVDPDVAQTGTTASRSSEPPGGSGVTIVAEDTAFDTTTLDATVGETLTITYDNRDDGIAHNLNVEGASGEDAKTDIEEGPTTQTLAVSFDDAGEFAYFCDVHPQRCAARSRCRRDRPTHPHAELSGAALWSLLRKLPAQRPGLLAPGLGLEPRTL
ncbi:MAG: cupredoxin domain-containing protein [Acidimicrobiales bacterium]